MLGNDMRLPWCPQMRWRLFGEDVTDANATAAATDAVAGDADDATSDSKRVHVADVLGIDSDDDEHELQPVPLVRSTSLVRMPTLSALLAESGKLRTLDRLLHKLLRSADEAPRKHRVLLYSQMTKMIDILEYCRIAM